MRDVLAVVILMAAFALFMAWAYFAGLSVELAFTPTEVHRARQAKSKVRSQLKAAASEMIDTALEE